VLIEAADPLGIEPILADLERSAGQRFCGKVFDSETNRVSGASKSLIADGLSPRRPEPTWKLLCLGAVVESVHLKLPQVRPL
jgi:hypothetical protein